MAVRTQGLETLLAQLSTDSERYFGDKGAVLEPVSRIERPFSTLLRFRVQAAGRDFHAFLKVFKAKTSSQEEVDTLKRWVEREFRATERLHVALSGRPGLTALRPIAMFPAQLALVTEEVQGETFDKPVHRALWGRAAAADVEAVSEGVGAWVRTYQQVTAVEGLLSLQERRDYLDVRLRQMAGHALTHAERDRALRLFDDLAAQVPASELGLVAIHADLSPTNILAGPHGEVTILDFAMAKTGARHHDVAHLYLHFDRLHWRPHVRRGLIERIKAALLRGYDPALAPSDPLFAIMLLQHAACYVAQFPPRGGLLAPVHRFILARRWNKSVSVAA